MRNILSLNSFLPGQLGIGIHILFQKFFRDDLLESQVLIHQWGQFETSSKKSDEKK
jgi:hypothetical protein